MRCPQGDVYGRTMAADAAEPGRRRWRSRGWLYVVMKGTNGLDTTARMRGSRASALQGGDQAAIWLDDAGSLDTHNESHTRLHRLAHLAKVGERASALNARKGHGIRNAVNLNLSLAPRPDGCDIASCASQDVQVRTMYRTYRSIAAPQPNRQGRTNPPETCTEYRVATAGSAPPPINQSSSPQMKSLLPPIRGEFQPGRPLVPPVVRMHLHIPILLASGRVRVAVAWILPGDEGPGARLVFDGLGPGEERGGGLLVSDLVLRGGKGGREGQEGGQG